MQTKRIHKAALAGWLSLAILSVPTGMAHPPETPAEETPDPRDFNLYLVATGEGNDVETSDSWYEPRELPIGLHRDPAATVTSDVSFVYTREPFDLSCIGWCYNEYLFGIVRNADADVRLEHQDVVEGEIQGTWDYWSNAGSLPGGSGHVGWLSLGLQVYGHPYAGPTYDLTVEGGELGGPVVFERTPFCDEVEDPDGVSCMEREDVSEGEANHDAEEVWTHDIVLFIELYVYDDQYPDSVLGSELRIDLDTAGGSFVTVKEYVAKPEASADGAEGGAEDGQGAEPSGEAVFEEADEAPVYAPGAPMAAVVGALAGAVAILRRRFA